MSRVTISDAEWRVMQVLWRRAESDRQGTAAAEVIAQLAEASWSHRTIRTMLARLAEKGVVAAVADGKRYLYRPLVSRQKCIRAEGRWFLQKVFGGDAAELLVHVVQDARITPQQIEELKRLLDEKRAPEE